MSFKHIDRINDALSVKKTRPSSIRSSSNIRCGSNLGVLSPPREESGDEARDVSDVKSPATPLKSSLRSISKKIQQFQSGKSPGGDGNDLAFSQSSSLSPNWQSPKSNSTHAPTTGDKGLTPTKQGVGETADTLKAAVSTDYEPRCDSSMVSSVDRQSSKHPKRLSRIDGSPGGKLRPKVSCDLDQKPSYAAIPGAKILNGKSTIRFQPKSSRADSEPDLVKIRISSMHSAGSGIEDRPNPAKNPSRFTKGVAGDQMDGTVNHNASETSCRGSFQDIRGEFERQGTVGNQPPFFPVQDSQFQSQVAQPPTTCAQLRKPSRTSPQKQSPKSKLGGRGDVKLGANKVKGLAAIFDSAARASPMVPTPGGSAQPKRRETTRVVSPYTSNPSPRASLQSVTSVSTPVSLMSHARNSASPPGTAEHSGRKSMIPRRQDASMTDVPGKAEGQLDSHPARRQEPRSSVQTGYSRNTQYRLPTPSRLPVKKKVSATGSPSLVQLDAQPDGSTRASMSPFKLTVQHELRPVGYCSTPNFPMTASDSHKGLPHLSEHSTTSGCSSPLTHSRKSSSLSPSPSRGRSASSLRDQIRSLRQELSSKNEECTQLRLEFQKSIKASQVSEMLLHEDLGRSRADCAKWRRRAEKAERKLDRFERLAMRIKDARERGRDQYGRSDHEDFSFVSGPDHIDIGERSSQTAAVARMNQGAMRDPPESSYDCGSLGVSAVDGMSDCSESTVVRNVNSGRDGGASALWTSVDELVDFAAPGLEDVGM